MKHRDWIVDGKMNGWEMPKTSFILRLPIIRQVRAIYRLILVELWYSIGPGSYCGIRSGYDSWVLYGIWHGLDK